MITDNRYIISKEQIRYRVQSSDFSVNSTQLTTCILWFVACGLKDKKSTVHYSKQLVLNTFFPLSFPLHRGETPEGKGVKKASCSVASMHRREACVFNPSSCQLNGKPMDVELTIRAC